MTTTRTTTAPSTVRVPARWAIRFRWLVAIAFALVPVVFTAAASAVAQILEAGASASALLIAGGAALSALVGLVVMRVSPPSLAAYGFRAPLGGWTVRWFLPLPLTVLIALVAQGVHVATMRPRRRSSASPSCAPSWSRTPSRCGAARSRPLRDPGAAGERT